MAHTEYFGATATSFPGSSPTLSCSLRRVGEDSGNEVGATAQQHNRPHTCQHHAEITQSHTFAALLRLSTTTHNLFTFNTSEISSHNSQKLRLLADEHLFSYTVFRLQKRSVALVKVHLQFCSRLHVILLTPKSLFPRPKT